MKVKYIGEIDSEDETLYIFQGGKNIYVCGGCELIDSNMEDASIGDKVEINGWYLCLSIDGIKTLNKLVKKGKKK